MSDCIYVQCLDYFYTGKVGDPKSNEATECIGNRWAEEIQGGWEVGAGDLREMTSPLTNSSFLNGILQFIPTCVGRGALGLECQSIITKRDVDFHCYRLKGFYDIQDNRKQCFQNSQKLLGGFFVVVIFIISCQEGEGHKQIFLYLEKDVWLYNVLKERKQTSLANAF